MLFAGEPARTLSEKGRAMPQKFEQMQSAEQKHDEDETIAQAGTQIDDTVDALDAVLDDIESVLESNAEEYVGIFVQKGGE